VVILEASQPAVTRRTVSFAQAVFDGRATVEGISAVRVSELSEVRQAWREGELPVLIDPEMQVNAELKPDVIIDATMSKRDTGLRCGMAPLTIALGPGFEAGRDAHVVIETKRGHDMGRLIFQGGAEPDTGSPAPIAGYSTERLLRAPCEGMVMHAVDIGTEVRRADVVCHVGNQPVLAPFDGIVRGLIMSGRKVPRGFKIGDIDPRLVRTVCYTISDRSRALGGSVLEAILYFRNRAEATAS
jgi:xanthine dehydrogenase accessory factor